MCHKLACGFFLAIVSTAAPIACGQIFVVDYGAQHVAKYSTSGAILNPALTTWQEPADAPSIAVSGGYLYVTNDKDGAVDKLTLDGDMVQKGLITGLLYPAHIAVGDGNIYVSDLNSQRIGKYALDGAAINRSLITTTSDYETAFAVSGGDLYVVYGFSGKVSKYTTAGTTLNAGLLSPFPFLPTDIAIAQDKIFVSYGGTVGEYTTSGAVVNANLISGLGGLSSVAALGSDLYVLDDGNGRVSKYSMSGDLEKFALISGLIPYAKMVVVAEPSTISLALLALVTAATWRHPQALDNSTSTRTK
jgi:hypothetical protein